VGLGKQYSTVRRWEAWQGSKSDILRLYRLIERASTRSQTLMTESTPQDAHGTTVADPRVYTYLIATTETVDTSGDYQEVIDDLDVRASTGIRMAATGSYMGAPRAVIEMNKSEPVSLRVDSPDVEWGTLHFGALSDEIRKGVPTWALMHRFSGIVAAPIVVSVVTAFLVFSVLSRTTLEQVWVGVIPPTVGLLAGFAMSQVQLRERLWPRFEVLSNDGASSVGDKNWNLLKSLLIIEIGIGLVVNVAAGFF
jgi:hypothetical protein